MHLISRKVPKADFGHLYYNLFLRMLFCGIVYQFAQLNSDAQSHSPLDEVPSQQDSSYRLVWADEFDVEGAPNPKKWKYERGFVRNKELQYYLPQNATCENGLLKIEAKRERMANEKFSESPKDWREKWRFAKYTSACLTTRGLHSWRYGRIFVRARVDARQGLWPAIWTVGEFGRWPECGEIDIMEYYAGDILANACWSSGVPWKAKWDAVKTSLASLGDSDWSSKFHLWCLDWDVEKLRIFVDHQLLNVVELEKTVSINRSPSKPYDQPHYLLLNLAVGGTKGGDPSNTEFPGLFEIDYVRVYQK